MKRFVIIYYDISYQIPADNDLYKFSRREVKEIPESFESEDEIKEWINEMETELAKEFIEKDVDFYRNVSAFITNIVKL
jgi:hypothetical protein